MSWIIFILVVFHCCLSNEKSYFDIELCQNDRCRLPYCYCSNQSIPGDLTVRDTPQFIAITINGPLEENIYKLLEDLFFSRKYFNPDGIYICLNLFNLIDSFLGCPISGTIFLKSHMETDYCLLRQVLKYRNIELGITSNSSE
jgi:hypothetical protein